MLIFTVVILSLALLIIILYNSLVSKKNQVTNAFSTVEVMLKKRFDLLPNLVELVKQYMKHESGVLTNLTILRTQAENPGLATGQKIALDEGVSKSVRSVMVNAENYPDLKANTNFINLQTTWTESEEQIAAARRTFNAAVTEYNNAIQMFPGRILAGLLHYEPGQVISIAEQERANLDAHELFAGNNG